CRHHAFDDHHILAGGNLLITTHHVLKQQIEFAIGQLTLHLFQRQWFGGLDIQRLLHQHAGALKTLVEWEGLGDGLEEANLQTGTFKRANQAKADRVEAASKTAWGEEKCMHDDLLSSEGRWRCRDDNPTPKQSPDCAIRSVSARCQASSSARVSSAI